LAGDLPRGTPFMTAKVFVDTNILIYAYDRDAGEKHRLASELVRRLWIEGNGVISTQVLQEFYVNATAKIPKPIPYSKARAVISRYLVWQVEANTPESVLRASEIQERHRLSFWDALIIAAAAQAGAENLYTEDLNHGQVIAGVEVINPFRAV
jgi:predicted nucleic acid-binding protein